MRHIVSLSGGKDSTAMLLMMIEKGMQIDNIIFVDTTKEYPQLYEHLEKLQEYIKPLKIDRVSFDYDYYFGEYEKVKGKRVGQKGYGFPDFTTRWCTSMKKSSINNYMKQFRGEDIIEYRGIAYDEKQRTLKNINDKARYPLVEWGIVE